MNPALGRPAGRLAAVLIALVATVAPLASPAGAHEGGKVQLYVVDLRAVPEGPSAWAVDVRLADADSGEPAAGFAVELSGVAPDGAALPAVALEELGTGRYRRRIDGAAGRWSLTVDARELPGAAPAVPLARTVPLTLDPAHATVSSAGAVRHEARGRDFPTVPVAAGVGAAIGLSLLARRRAEPAVSRERRRSPSL